MIFDKSITICNRNIEKFGKSTTGYYFDFIKKHLQYGQDLVKVLTLFETGQINEKVFRHRMEALSFKSKLPTTFHRGICDVCHMSFWGYNKGRNGDKRFCSSRCARKFKTDQARIRRNLERALK